MPQISHIPMTASGTVAAGLKSDGFTRVSIRPAKNAVIYMIAYMATIRTGPETLRTSGIHTTSIVPHQSTT